MATTRKRKRAKSQPDGKQDTGNGTTAEPIAPDPLPPTKKSRSQHPQKTQSPVFSAPLIVHHPVLSLYFPTLLLLRSFLEQILCFSSKSTPLGKLEEISKRTDADLSFLLDTSLVGLKELRTQNAVPDIEDATQSTGGSRPATSSQAEVLSP